MRVIAGPEKKARLLSEKEQRITAYHEMGHALVGHFLENTNPIHKITIVSRGQALGLTISLPTEDRYMQSKPRAPGGDRDDARRPRGGGARLRRGHDRRRERHREDHRHRQADGDALRDEREARPARPRPQRRACRSSAARWATSPTTPTSSRARSTTRCGASSRTATSSRCKVLREHMDDLHRISQILIERETIDKDQFDPAARRRVRGRRSSRPRSRTPPAPEPKPRHAHAAASRARSRCPGRRCSRPSPKARTSHSERRECRR